jgi:hypothetical protein
MAYVKILSFVLAFPLRFSSEFLAVYWTSPLLCSQEHLSETFLCSVFQQTISPSSCLTNSKQRVIFNPPHQSHCLSVLLLLWLMAGAIIQADTEIVLCSFTGPGSLLRTGDVRVTKTWLSLWSLAYSQWGDLRTRNSQYNVGLRTMCSSTSSHI